MSRDQWSFAFWALLILAGATGVILYQHALHTRAVIAAVLTSPDSGGSEAPQPDPANTISSNPGWSGAFSRASGQWTPLGPWGMNIFGYNPPQNQL